MQGGYDVCRLRIEFEGGEIPWLYSLALNGRVIKAMFADGEPVERVVRCRDCRFSLAHGNGCGRNQDIYDAEPDGFCAWGERKEGGDD